MSLLSVWALTRMDIEILFMPGYAVLYNLQNNFKILGYGRQDHEGL